jgi:hypothetical protein
MCRQKILKFVDTFITNVSKATIFAEGYLLFVIIGFMLSVSLFSKVITLSGFSQLL